MNLTWRVQPATPTQRPRPGPETGGLRAAGRGARGLPGRQDVLHGARPAQGALTAHGRSSRSPLRIREARLRLTARVQECRSCAPACRGCPAPSTTGRRRCSRRRMPCCRHEPTRRRHGSAHASGSTPSGAVRCPARRRRRIPSTRRSHLPGAHRCASLWRSRSSSPSRRRPALGRLMPRFRSPARLRHRPSSRSPRSSPVRTRTADQPTRSSRCRSRPGSAAARCPGPRHRDRAARVRRRPSTRGCRRS